MIDQETDHIDLRAGHSLSLSFTWFLNLFWLRFLQNFEVSADSIPFTPADS
jgi:hypothetical protein